MNHGYRHPTDPRPPSTGRQTGSVSLAGRESVIASAARAVRAALQRVGFWTAVSMPLGYIYLFYNGLMAADPIRFVGLLGLHFVALLVGRGYKVRAAAERRVSAYREWGDRAEEQDETPEQLEALTNSDV